MCRAVTLLLLAASCGGSEARLASEASGPPPPGGDPGRAASEAPPGEEAAVLLFSGRALGVEVELQVLEGDWGQLSSAQRAAMAELSRLEDIANPWDSGSELSRWNDGPPAGGRVSPEMAELVAAAQRLCRESGGAFDPTVGALLAARGHYGEPIPLAADPEELVGCDRVRLVETPDGPRLERLHPGVRLDLSGIAKGWAADRVKAQLVAAGVTNACLDLGSSTIVAWGPGPDGRGWCYRLPAGAAEESWWLRDEAAATSSATPASLDPADLTGMHLVDPRSGADVPQVRRSVVTRGRSALDCDAWATAIAAAGATPTGGAGVTALVVGDE